MPSRGECIDLRNVRQYLHLMCFYKADIAAVLAAGQRLIDIRDVEDFTEKYNGQLKLLLPRGKKEGDFRLEPKHFEQCDVPLSSSLDCMVEAREFMRNFSSPFKELRGVFRTIQGFKKMWRLADAVLKVEVGRRQYVFAVVDALDALGASETMRINREFAAVARWRELGPTEMYVLAASLLALHGGGAAGRLVLQGGKFFSSAAVDGNALPQRYAEFYVELARAGSEYTEAVASSLLTYMNTRDPARLYEIVRNMLHAMNRKRLRREEAEALMRLLGHEESS